MNKKLSSIFDASDLYLIGISSDHPIRISVNLNGDSEYYFNTIDTKIIVSDDKFKSFFNIDFIGHDENNLPFTADISTFEISECSLKETFYPNIKTSLKIYDSNDIQNMKIMEVFKLQISTEYNSHLYLFDKALILTLNNGYQILVFKENDRNFNVIKLIKRNIDDILIDQSVYIYETKSFIKPKKIKLYSIQEF